MTVEQLTAAKIVEARMLNNTRCIQYLKEMQVNKITEIRNAGKTVTLPPELVVKVQEVLLRELTLIDRNLVEKLKEI